MRSEINYRLFVGLDASPLSVPFAKVKEVNNSLIAKWTKSSQLHITLCFLGKTRSGNLPKIEDNLARIASQYKNFNIEVKRVGPSPNKNKPMIWAYIQLDQQLKDLYFEINKEISQMPYRPNYTPHISLARLGRSIIKQKVKTVPVTDMKMSVDRITIWKSETFPSGSKHSVLKTFNFEEL